MHVGDDEAKGKDLPSIAKCKCGKEAKGRAGVGSLLTAVIMRDPVVG